MRHMNEELERIEMKVCYLEGLVSELNEVAVTQEKEITELEKKLRLLEKKVEDLIEESGEARPNRRPPHY